MTLSKKDVHEKIREMMISVNNGNRISDVESDFVTERGLTIENDGHDVKLVRGNIVLVSIPYFTVGAPSGKDWENFDKQIDTLSI